MKKLTLRIDDDLYQVLVDYSDKYNKSINNILCDIIFLYFFGCDNNVSDN